jgi:hypothetical protein
LTRAGTGGLDLVVVDDDKERPHTSRELTSDLLEDWRKSLLVEVTAELLDRLDECVGLDTGIGRTGRRGKFKQGSRFETNHLRINTQVEIRVDRLQGNDGLSSIN